MVNDSQASFYALIGCGLLALACLALGEVYVDNDETYNSTLNRALTIESLGTWDF